MGVLVFSSFYHLVASSTWRCSISSSYVHLPTEPIPYDSTMPESRVHYMDGENGDSGSQQDGQQNRCTIQNGIGNHPVPIQIVRPQQVRSKKALIFTFNQIGNMFELT